MKPKKRKIPSGHVWRSAYQLCLARIRMFWNLCCESTRKSYLFPASVVLIVFTFYLLLEFNTSADLAVLQINPDLAKFSTGFNFLSLMILSRCSGIAVPVFLFLQNSDRRSFRTYKYLSIPMVAIELANLLMCLLVLILIVFSFTFFMLIKTPTPLWLCLIVSILFTIQIMSGILIPLQISKLVCKWLCRRIRESWAKICEIVVILFASALLYITATNIQFGSLFMVLPFCLLLLSCACAFVFLSVNLRVRPIFCDNTSVAKRRFLYLRTKRIEINLFTNYLLLLRSACPIFIEITCMLGLSAVIALLLGYHNEFREILLVCAPMLFSLSNGRIYLYRSFFDHCPRCCLIYTLLYDFSISLASFLVFMIFLCIWIPDRQAVPKIALSVLSFIAIHLLQIKFRLPVTDDNRVIRFMLGYGFAFAFPYIILFTI